MFGGRSDVEREEEGTEKGRWKEKLVLVPQTISFILVFVKKNLFD